MSRTLVLFVAVIACVAGASGRSVAGPVPWTYHAEVSDGTGGSWVYFGTDTDVQFDPTTGQETRTPYLVLAEIGATANGEGFGAMTVPVLSVSQSRLRGYAAEPPDPWALSRPTYFRLEATITDTASGQSQALDYSVRGTGQLFAATGTGIVSLWTEEGTDTFVLGGNRYTARAVARESESAAHLELAVTAEPAATPEPGSLLLAGVGLAGLGFVRRVGRRMG
jgi:PEP-CTERM motif